MARPCGMCARVCWQCQGKHDRLVAEFEWLEQEQASLWLAYAEADDAARPEISDQLADVTNALSETADALDAVEEGEVTWV